MIFQSPFLVAFQEKLKNTDQSFLFEKLWGSPKALLAHLILQTTKKSVLIITSGAKEDLLYENLLYFAPNQVLEFPSWETLPGEEISPSTDILGKRFETLYQLLDRQTPSIVLCPIQALLQKTISPKTALDSCFIWKKKSKFPFQKIPSLLLSLGYRKVAVVSDKGEFALRGDRLDIFPTATTNPYRIEFFEDEIEEIRIFDCIGQKTIGKESQVFICPANEMDLLKKETTPSLILDYLTPDHPWIFWDDLLHIENEFVERITKSPFFTSFPELLQKTPKSRHLFCTENPIDTVSEITKKSGQTDFEILNHRFLATHLPHPFHKINPEAYPDDTLFLARNEAEEEEMKKLIPSLPINSRFERGYLSEGFFLLDAKQAIVSYSDITHKARLRRQKWRSTHHSDPSEFHKLEPGDLVVHSLSGIGKYTGVEKQKNHLGEETEFLSIEYAEGGKLFVPLIQSHLVSKYVGAQEQIPTLSQLGSKKWQTVKAHAQTQIVGYAHDLLRLYAERALGGKIPTPPDGDLMRQFEEDFPYEPTEDQKLAIQAIKLDMMSDKPMDRLICGDVGYGKTEVAMRAAFKAVVDAGKQVAVLTPTTILTMQHFETFSERMSLFPVKLGAVSRFATAKHNKEVLEKVKTGDIDLLVGTHRILSKDVQFKNLGLIIIDEEQRFGVRAKEHLKKLKSQVDCLTLSATPIPRTLYMSIVSAKQMSLINTPPQDRLPVQTIIAETDFDLIQQALVREFGRGGQAFFIHNRVESIASRAEIIGQLVPTARIGIVHGQMDSDAIDNIFHEFKNGTIDLLFATTIVESGVDIPNANTIIIDRADTYGLADLYQLKGRVGRWNKRAYAYFLTPKNVRLSEISTKRLHALASAQGYGGGMKIAMQDLEIRGAGDIIGTQQSGQVSSIGFYLYCKLLKKAMHALTSKAPISFHETKLESPFPAYLPERYIDDLSIRMELYHRFGDTMNLNELDALLAEITDRFGPPPTQTLWLYHLSKIKAYASSRLITSIKFHNHSISVEKTKGTTIEKSTIPLPLPKNPTPDQVEAAVLHALSR
jgi:transcription-repair coupling factor (superfamily II helicase)